MGIDLSKALDGIPVVATSTDRDTRYPTPSTNQRVYRLDTGCVELWNGAAWSVVLAGQTTGSWTPAMVGASTAGTFTYTTQSGYYVKVGNLVTAWCYMAVSGTSVSASGNLTVAGLPFAASNLPGLYQSAALGEIDGITITSGFTQLVGYVAPNTTALILRKVGSAQAAVQLAGSDLTASWGLMFTLSYRTA